MKKAASLDLSAVVLRNAGGHKTAISDKAVSITFAFGDAAMVQNGIPFPSPAAPLYLLVEEWLQPHAGGPMVDRAEGSTCGPGWCHPVASDWQFTGSLGDAASVSVVSNTSRSTVADLGGAISAAADSH